MKRALSLLLLSLLVLALAPTASTHAAPPRSGTTATTPNTITVLVGLGQVNVSPGSYLGYTPRYVDVSVGDTVVFKNIDQLEPHTVTFGPMALLKQLNQAIFIPEPQKSGPPLLVGNPKAIMPTPGNTYDGTGLANSGLMSTGQSWRLTFTQPGAYHYICLLHGTIMQGVVVAHPRPQAQGHVWIVQAGDGPAARNDPANNAINDSFYPRHLTVHVGDTVEWIGGFHTITFGPEAMIQQLEKTVFMPVPQTSGPPKLVFNPKVAFPSGGATYNGSGFVNSGVLVLNAPRNSKAPPSFKLTFTQPGVYTYDCLIHPGMDGTVTVAP